MHLPRILRQHSQIKKKVKCLYRWVLEYSHCENIVIYIFIPLSRIQTESKNGFLKMPRSKSIIVNRVEFEINQSINQPLNSSN